MKSESEIGAKCRKAAREDIKHRAGEMSVEMMDGCAIEGLGKR